MSAKILHGLALACALDLLAFVSPADAGGGRDPVTCCERRLDCCPRGLLCCRTAQQPDCCARAWSCCRQPLYYRCCTAKPDAARASPTPR
jgi:hypothetical protein